MSVSDNFADTPAPVRFDRRNEARVIPHEVAEEMLMAWRERNAAQFGYWLASALTGAEPRKSGQKSPRTGA
jgi:hypothetical protein